MSHTIVTGLYPEHHGIEANSFYDPARKETYSYHDSKSVGKNQKNERAVQITGVRRDDAAQFEINLPVVCSSELVARMIYANIAKVFPEDVPIRKRYFQGLKIPLFQ